MRRCRFAANVHVIVDVTDHPYEPHSDQVAGDQGIVTSAPLCTPPASSGAGYIAVLIRTTARPIGAIFPNFLRIGPARLGSPHGMPWHAQADVCLTASAKCIEARTSKFQRLSHSRLKVLCRVRDFLSQGSSLRVRPS